MLRRMIEIIEEDAFYAYEEILVMSHEYIHNGGFPYIAYRVDRRLQKLVWKGYYTMTEARLYLANHDLEGSAQSAKAALKVARSLHSQMVEDDVKSLYRELDEKSTLNPYVRNLGLELGIF